jgi:hypothetical protein
MKDKLKFPFYALPKALAPRKDIQASDKVLFSVIRDYLSDNGTGFPGIRTLSQNTGLSLSTVVESIRRLEAKKILKVKRQGKGQSNHYSMSKSALKSSTVNKKKRTENQNGQENKAHRKPNTSVPKISTEAHRKSEHKEKERSKEKYTQQFEQARKIYPGTKRGCETEFANFEKHKDWKKVLPLLKPAIEKQIEWRRESKAANIWVPKWKNFQTWINNRCWEDEIEIESVADAAGCGPCDEEDARRTLRQAGLWKDQT